MKSRSIVFVFGGPGHEHDVSCATAQSAMPQFDSSLRICPVFITKDREWVVHDTYVSPDESWGIAQQLQTQSGLPVTIALDYIEELKPEIIFIGLHGEYGEDGTIQALLDARGLSYTGSDAEATALAIDKPKVLQLLQDEGIAVPEFLELDRALKGEDAKQFIAFHSLPVMVLPADGGSSIGVTPVRELASLDAALARAWEASDRIIMTNFIDGREVSCGLLVTGSTTLLALPPTEIEPLVGHDFFDYDAKYTKGATVETTPPNVVPDLLQKIQATAKRVHQLIGADGYSRVDIIIHDDEPYVLEINTLPGLTPTSILPQEANAFSISFSQLLTYICDAVDNTGREYSTAVSD